MNLQLKRDRKDLRYISLPLDLTEVKVEALDGSKIGEFTGYGAVFGNEDAYGDVIQKGAFKQTIKEWKEKDLLPPLLLNHGGWAISSDDLLPVGAWLSMREDDKGLLMKGKIDPLDTDKGKTIYTSLKNKSLNGLSIGFMIREFVNGTRAGEPRRTLTNIDLWEVSAVTFPANDKARVSDVKSLTSEEVRELEARLRDGGISRRDSLIAVSILKTWLARDVQAVAQESRDDDSDGLEALMADLDKLTDQVAAATLSNLRIVK